MRTKLLKWSSFTPHFTQKVSCSPFPKCVSLQYIHFLHEMCNVVNTHFLKTFHFDENNDLRSSKAEKYFTLKGFFPPNDKCLPWVLTARFCFRKHWRFVNLALGLFLSPAPLSTDPINSVGIIPNACDDQSQKSKSDIGCVALQCTSELSPNL